MSLIDRLPEHLKNRQTAEAVTTPSAILLFGAGAAGGILAGVGVPIAVGIGALAWAVRVAFGLPRRPRQPRIDLGRLGQPWRTFVREAIDAQTRYRRAIASESPGPLRDRLAEIGERLDAGVQECYRIAQRGAALESGLASLDTGVAWTDLTHELEAQRVPVPLRERIQHGETIRDNSELGAALRTAGVSEGGVDMLEALQAQVLSAQRLSSVAQDARQRLELLDARLDEAVARAVELSLQADDVGALSGLGGDVDSLVGEMESLRLALDEAGRASAAGAGGTTSPRRAAPGTASPGTTGTGTT